MQLDQVIHILVTVELEIMVVKRYSKFLKAAEQEPHY